MPNGAAPLAPVDVAASSSSSFRDLLAALDLSDVNRILDVGAGGFVGAVTTEHLLDLFPEAELVACEINSERAEQLASKFGERISVFTGDVAALEAEPFDLVVLDLHSAAIPLMFETLLPDTMLGLTHPGSIVINVVFTDVIGAFSSPGGLNPDGAGAAASFMLRHFGRLLLRDEQAKDAYAQHSQYEALVLVEKFRDAPRHSVGWLALQRRAGGPAGGEAPRHSLDAETQELIAAGELRSFDLVSRSPDCTTACGEFARKWSGWAREAFGGWAEADGVLEAPVPELSAGEQLIVGALPGALLDATGTPDAYRAQIGAKSRNMLRKVERLGYTFAEFSHDDHLDELHAINTSKPERSGRPMSDSYLAPLKPRGPTPAPCPHHRRHLVGAFEGETLWAYCDLAIVGELAVIDRILGHGDRLRDGIMNGLVAALRDLCASLPRVKAINYLTLRSSTPELDRFKRSVGFTPHPLLMRVESADPKARRSG